MQAIVDFAGPDKLLFLDCLAFDSINAELACCKMGVAKFARLYERALSRAPTATTGVVAGSPGSQQNSAEREGPLRASVKHGI